MAKSDGVLKKLGKQAGKVASGAMDVAGTAVGSAADAAGAVVARGRDMVPGVDSKPSRRRSSTTSKRSTGIHGKLASGDRKGTRWNAEAFDGESVDNPGLGHGFR